MEEENVKPILSVTYAPVNVTLEPALVCVLSLKLPLQMIFFSRRGLYLVVHFASVFCNVDCCSDNRNQISPPARPTIRFLTALP